MLLKEWSCGCKLEYEADQEGKKAWWTREHPYYTSCQIHVKCDELCMALKEPKTFEEYKTAYEHWRNHSEASGCSHGR